MHSRREYRGLTWLDLQSPTAREARDLISEFGILPHVGEELITPNSKQRGEFYGSFFYLVMHFPLLRSTEKKRYQEINFIVGRNVFITARYEYIEALRSFERVFETHAALANEPLGEHAGYLFYYALRKLYSEVEHELDYAQGNLDRIEEHIFNGHEKQMVESISHIARSLLDLRRTIEPHREILASLEEQGSTLFGDEFTPFLRALTREYFRVHNHQTRIADALRELRETNNSLLTTKQNETLKLYTIMAFFTFPLALITAVLGIHSASNPVLGRPYDFWILVGILLTTLIIMFIFFKHKGWL